MGFVATVLICLNATPSTECSVDTAVDVLPKRVTNELGCWLGSQEMVAKSALAADIGKTVYMRQTCTRLHGDQDAIETPAGPRKIE